MMSRTRSKMKSAGRNLNRRVTRSATKLLSSAKSKISSSSRPESGTMSRLKNQQSRPPPPPPLPNFNANPHQAPSNYQSAYIPPPPPPPPPLTSDDEVGEAEPITPGPKSKYGPTIAPHRSKGRRSLDEVGTKSRGPKESQRRHSDPANYSLASVQDTVKTLTAVSNNEIVTYPELRGGRIDDEIEIERNDVPFWEEDSCSDADDEFNFTCCIPPYSPRFPPNPRPQRQWDPSFLPQGTNIPTSIGRPCKRCGKLVYLAELHLSSRGAYHTECFKCCLCGKSLDSWSMAEYKGEIFCKGCYRRNFSLHGAGFGVGAGVLQTP